MRRCARSGHDGLVGPRGATGWVVDAKCYGGRLECRDVGGWFRTDRRLFVGGQDRTSLLDGVRRQVDHVRSALADGPWAAVPVRGALCFVDTEIGLFAKPFHLDDVLVSWPRRLIPAMADVVGTTAVGPEQRGSLLRELAGRFPGA